ncbi:MAG TPA: hypothetical protein PLV06_09530 [Bacteroidales bacterium]|nr:hypothetical protein [Bacteroidales bacterium]HPJ59411.1 hypothetical protein [Bacteroidales bacterium]HPR12612.1 hypothetical protein [Bacteroidales bacterium]HRW86103.1 hypothetical protein [Bacteroidales bacterium]
MEEFKNISDKNPFRVPENYFEEVSARIIESTAGKEPETKPAGLLHRLRPYMAVAASVAALAVLTVAALRYFDRGDILMEMPDISFQDITDNYLHEIDLLTLEESVASTPSWDDISEISNNEIIDYLLSENIELNEIYELL